MQVLEPVFPRNLKKINYETPQTLVWNILHKWKLWNYKFTDVCATEQNKKFPRYISKKQNALKLKWNFPFFMNPPFDDLDTWVRYAYRQHKEENSTGFMIVPCYTDSSWWTDCIGDHMQKCDNFHFLHTRLGFLFHNKEVRGKNGKPQKYFMPCAFILYRKK